MARAAGGIVLTFVLKRIGFLFVVLAGVSVLTFVIANIAPGDPARMMAGPQADAGAIAKIREDLGLDRPLLVQYGRYAGRLLEGDLGVSNVSGQPVVDEIVARAPATIELTLGGLIVALVIGVPLGVLASLRRGRLADILVRILAVAGAAVPAFWFGLLLILLFYRELGWFPGAGRFTGEPPAAVTGFMTIDALVAGDWSALKTACAHLALPVFALAILDLGILARLTRNQMLGQMRQDYVRVARSAGLREREIVRSHVMRNALSPLVGVVTVALANLLYGSVSVETVFSWPGAGQYLVNSIFALDFPVIVAFAVMASIAYVLFSLAGDLVYASLDPRVRR